MLPLRPVVSLNACINMQQVRRYAVVLEYELDASGSKVLKSRRHKILITRTDYTKSAAVVHTLYRPLVLVNSCQLRELGCLRAAL
jgi:hypothetical protein